MLESKFQRMLIKKLESMFDGCLVLKNDPNFIQGIPDLMILHHNKWAALEVKKECASKHQTNQDWYVDKMNGMSFARFISPDNEEEVLHELYGFFIHE